MPVPPGGGGTAPWRVPGAVTPRPRAGAVREAAAPPAGGRAGSPAGRLHRPPRGVFPPDAYPAAPSGASRTARRGFRDTPRRVSPPRGAPDRGLRVQALPRGGGRLSQAATVGAVSRQGTGPAGPASQRGGTLAPGRPRRLPGPRPEPGRRDRHRGKPPRQATRPVPSGLNRVSGRQPTAARQKGDR
jgi:hypothetical protein